MDGDSLNQLIQIIRELHKVVYSVKKPESMLFDIDSTLLNTCRKHEGEDFNYHYQAHGCHSLLCYDSLTGGMLKAELRDGTMYCGRDAGVFIQSLLDGFTADYPDLFLYLRSDSGFTAPGLYEVPESRNYKYATRLKENAKLREQTEQADQALCRATKFNQTNYTVEYGEFLYQAGSRNHLRRVVFQVEKPYGQSIIHVYCHHNGNDSLSGVSILLRERQKGALYQRRKRRF